jgi:hypothetical protein
MQKPETRNQKPELADTGFLHSDFCILTSDLSVSEVPCL